MSHLVKSSASCSEYQADSDDIEMCLAKRAEVESRRLVGVQDSPARVKVYPNNFCEDVTQITQASKSSPYLIVRPRSLSGNHDNNLLSDRAAVTQIKQALVSAMCEGDLVEVERILNSPLLGLEKTTINPPTGEGCLTILGCVVIPARVYSLSEFCGEEVKADHMGNALLFRHRDEEVAANHTGNALLFRHRNGRVPTDQRGIMRSRSLPGRLNKMVAAEQFKQVVAVPSRVIRDQVDHTCIRVEGPHEPAAVSKYGARQCLSDFLLLVRGFVLILLFVKVLFGMFEIAK